MTQTEQAEIKIESMLVFNELQDMKLYSESQIAAMVGFGRTPTREALQRLAHDNMIIILPRKGVMAVAVTASMQLNLLDVRRCLDPQCIRLAALRGTITQKKTMYRLAQKFFTAADAADQHQVFACLRETHELLTEATHNPFFARALGPLQGPSRRFWFYDKDREDTLKGAHLHADILEHTAKGNQDAAVEAGERLLHYLTDFAFIRLQTEG